MAEILVIGVIGAALAWLCRSGVLDAPRPATHDLAAIEVPDDLWAAFEASSGGTGATLTAVAGSTATTTTTGRRTTVGGLEPGDSGFVHVTAVRTDGIGAVWLDAAAVVHPTPRHGRVAVRRNGPAYELQDPRHLLDDADPRTPNRTSIRVDTLFH